jgi:hypothetical protein
MILCSPHLFRLSLTVYVIQLCLSCLISPGAQFSAAASVQVWGGETPRTARTVSFTHAAFVDAFQSLFSVLERPLFVVVRSETDILSIALLQAAALVSACHVEQRDSIQDFLCCPHTWCGSFNCFEYPFSWSRSSSEVRHFCVVSLLL